MRRLFPVLLLSGCSNISFQVSPDADSTPSSNEHDDASGEIGMPEAPDAAIDGGPSSFDGGDARSSNCYMTGSAQADAGCGASEETFWCDEYGGKTDVMPSCTFKFALNVNTNLYCCP